MILAVVYRNGGEVALSISRERVIQKRGAERPSDEVRALLCGLPSSKINRWDLVMLQAFFDDSGSGGDSKYFVLSGYKSNLETWVKFTDNWQTVLDLEPAIRYFKMREAESRKGEFAGFTDAARNAKVASLIEVIRGHRLREITCAIPQVYYDDLIKGKFPKDYDDPYFFCFGAILSLSMAGAQQGVSFVFDSNQRLERPSKLVYELSKSLLGYSHLIANIDYRDDKEFPPLQAADLIAWQTRRFLCHMEGTRKELRRLHEGLQEGRDFDRFILKRKNLEKLLEAARRFSAR